MDRHPGIVFRGGPAGRRPGLAGGPDVWEVIRAVNNAETRGDGAIAEAASWLALSAGESLADTPLKLTPGERAELASRSDALDADVAANRPLGRPWSEIRARLT